MMGAAATLDRQARGRRPRDRADRRHEPGGGNDTGIAQIVADELGLPLDAIEIVQGDTGRCPEGFGNYSGRSTLLGGSAAALAARELRGRLLRCRRGQPRARCGDAHARRGAVRSGDDGTAVASSPRRSRWPAPARRRRSRPRVEYQPQNTSLVPDERGRIQPYPTYSNAVMGAVVEVDPATGAVALRDFAACHDCGVMINPMLVEGQLRGAIAMGIGGAVTEALTHDRHGRLVSDRFKTYLLPRASDLPPVRIAHQVTPSPFTLLGTKGAGEAGVGGTQAALANAVADALAPLGVAIDGLPLSPPAILAKIHAPPRTRRSLTRAAAASASLGHALAGRDVTHVAVGERGVCAGGPAFSARRRSLARTAANAAAPAARRRTALEAAVESSATPFSKDVPTLPSRGRRPARRERTATPRPRPTRRSVCDRFAGWSCEPSAAPASRSARCASAR